jgi:UDP-N-acetyl-2-amino-2-deoxyglucuronate dehydrogenase
MLAEASYLVRMAGRKLWLEQDLTTASALLIDADSRIQAIADPSLIPLRKALADDIAKLKSAPEVDREGLSLRVGTLLDNIDQLKIIEEETGKKVYNILQLRLHDSIIALKEKISKELEKNPNRIYDLDLTYLTSRGKWYFVSWKGDEAKSGGIASNIGVHFFDMLSWIFGEIQENIVHIKEADTNAGYMKLKNANVRWFLSVNYDYIPEDIKETGKRTYRSIRVDGEEFEFSEGFTDLHTKSYEHILNGGGFGLEEARNSINIVSEIRKLQPIGLTEQSHPFCKKVLG